MLPTAVALNMPEWTTLDVTAQGIQVPKQNCVRAVNHGLRTPDSNPWFASNSPANADDTSSVVTASANRIFLIFFLRER
jgi:hypothetical protein